MLAMATILYLTAATVHDKKTIVNMVNQASQTQPQPVRSYLQELLENRAADKMQGKIEGEKKAMKIAEEKARLEKERVVTNILLKFPQLTDAEVAEVCVADAVFVKKIRAKLKKQACK